jgi:group I intron endonuclease
MSYIYKITNQVNNKIYIGATTRHPSIRFEEHCADAVRFPDRPFYIAINKYGIDNFELEIIEECESNKLEEREEYWIEYYGSFKNGYNATLGGGGKKYLDYDLIAETYRQIGSSIETAHRLGISEDSVRIALKAKEEKIRTYQEVISDKYGKMVNMFDLDGTYIMTFPSTADAARYIISNGLTNCKFTTIRFHITEACRGDRKSAAKFKWAYVK